MSEVPLYPSVAVLGVFSAVDVRGCGAVCVSLGAGESLVIPSRLSTNLLIQSLHPAASSSVAAPGRFRLFSRKRERKGESEREGWRERGKGGGVGGSSLAFAVRRFSSRHSRWLLRRSNLLIQSLHPAASSAVAAPGRCYGGPSCAGFLFERTADAPP
jgi:hypothetical protein